MNIFTVLGIPSFETELKLTHTEPALVIIDDLQNLALNSDLFLDLVTTQSSGKK